MERINEILSQYKIPIALSLVGLVLIIGGLFSSGLFKQSNKPKIPAESIVLGNSAVGMKVDISGAVVAPGVYELSSNERMEDLLKKAGGFSASASAEYVSKTINLASKLSDGQKVYIPFEGEDVRAFQVAGAATSSKLVGVNSATPAQLEALPGIGAVTAEKIINKRPYASVDELLTKKVVSKSVYDKIKDLVDIN